jgi:D-sedoheptulose 7-phosphate isomerase
MKRGIESIGEYFKAAAEVQRQAGEACAESILASVQLISAALAGSGKVLLCGNGGSAADCQHMAAELVGTLNRDVKRQGLAAVALTTDTSFLTAYANDFGFDGVFERQVEALGKPGDVLVAISTSGRSENVRRAVHAARERSLRSVGLFGDGAPLAGDVDCAIVVPSRDTQHVQETMLAIEHLICQLVVQELFGEKRA